MSDFIGTHGWREFSASVRTLASAMSKLARPVTKVHTQTLPVGAAADDYINAHLAEGWDLKSIEIASDAPTLTAVLVKR